MVASIMGKYFPPPADLVDYCNKPSDLAAVISNSSLIPSDLVNKLDETGRIPTAGDVKYIFLTKAGPGPIAQPLSESLLSPATGLPVPPSSRHKRMDISKTSGAPYLFKIEVSSKTALSAAVASGAIIAALFYMRRR
jgi:hypothetical protein